MGMYDEYSWGKAPEPIPSEKIVDRIETDVVVVGAGFAGCAAACSAREMGLDVVQVEKRYRYSARGLHIGVANSRLLASEGIVNDIDEICRTWISVTGSRAKESVIRTFLTEGENAMNWLLDKTEAAGINCRIFAGGYKGETYKEYTCTHLFDGGADRIVKLLNDTARETGVHQLFDTTAKQLLREPGGRITGIIVEDADGYKQIDVSKGVILATGDISGNVEMMRDLAPMGLKANFCDNPEAAFETGDGHKMAVWVGAKMQDGPWPCTIHLMAFSMETFFFLLLDQNGKRFMNEDAWAQGKAVQMILNDEEHPYGYVIMDSKWKQEVQDTIQYGGGLFWEDTLRDIHTPFNVESVARTAETCFAEEQVGWKCDTLEELAEKTGIPYENLKASVDRYNYLVEKGHDDDFGKRKEFLTSITEPPFFALKTGGALLNAPGGLSIDEQLRVLDEHNDPIPGLYAAGNCAGDLYAIDYPLLIAGNNHGHCLTWGYLSGRNIAKL
ncbi:MAG: FAD-dependent oxidoreductase [Coriobacteriales bacterium]|jgi:fumarate reductase flavoprotein subunit